MAKILFLSDYFLNDGILGGAERSDATLIEVLQRRGLDVTLMHTSDVIGIKSILHHECHTEFYGILISNRTRMSRDTKDMVINCGVPYYIIERDCQFVKSRNVASYKNYIAPPSQINNEVFYNTAANVFALCESHYSKMMLNLPKARLINLGSTHLDSYERELMKTLRSTERKNPQRIGIPKIKDWSNAARYARLMYPDSILEFFDANPSREAFLKDVASYEKIAFMPFVYESFSRLSLECKMLGCEVITEKPHEIGVFDSTFWCEWIGRGCDIDEVYERVDNSIVTLTDAILGA